MVSNLERSTGFSAMQKAATADQKINTDGDVHGLLGTHLVGEQSGKELHNGVSEKEDRPRPSDLYGRQAKVLLNARQKGQDADAVKRMDEKEGTTTFIEKHKANFKGK